MSQSLQYQNKQTVKEQFIEAMKSRTKKLAVETIKLCRQLPNTDEARIVAKQIVRSSKNIIVSEKNHVEVKNL